MNTFPYTPYINGDLQTLVLFAAFVIALMLVFNSVLANVQGGSFTHFIVAVCIAVLFLYLYRRFIGYDITIGLSKLFSGNELDITLQKERQVADDLVGELEGDQVFNVSDNVFNYKDAPSVCKAYGARLATLEEVYDAYNNGAEWCNYGWTKNQFALFPTQRATWERLQKMHGHKHDCGRPGVNGGWFPAGMRFGVNCYGKRPRINAYERDQMRMEQHDAISLARAKEREKIAKYRAKLDRLAVLPFNRKQWSE